LSPADKDFFQLLDDKTIQERPVQKDTYDWDKVIEEFGIHPVNFALARAMVGDASDNLPGINRVGPPTVAKRLPFSYREQRAPPIIMMRNRTLSILTAALRKCIPMSWKGKS
jgi:DNA polymerase-1